MKPGIQRILETIGENGCLALCWGYITGCTDLETINGILIAMAQGVINENDCFINDNRAYVRILFQLQNKNEEINIKFANTHPNGIVSIAKYYNSRTAYSHFVVVNGDGKVIFDPLGDSVTVKEGHPVEWRWLA